MPDTSQFANVSGNYHSNGSALYKTFARTVKFAEGLGDGIEEMGEVIRSYIDDPDKLFESGETLANTALTLTTLLAEGPVATAAGIGPAYRDGSDDVELPRAHSLQLIRYKKCYFKKAF